MAKWIKGAIGHPGALHKQLGVPQGKKIPAAKLEKATHAGGKLGQRARLAGTLGSLRGRGNRGQYGPQRTTRTRDQRRAGMD